MDKHTLLLWDIDGTIIISQGAGVRAMERGFKEQFGKECDLADIAWAGRTDTWIVRTVLRHNQLPDSPENIDAYLQAYLRTLPQELAHGPQGQILPGVLELLETFHHHDGIAQGLLTGNSAAGAKHKLSHYGVWDYFPFGAFADDSPLRNDLGPYAQRRAKELHGVDFSPQNTFIIGDTPHDIECGKVIGAQTIAVATGETSSEELRRHEPTIVFENLSDTAAFLKAIGA